MKTMNLFNKLCLGLFLLIPSLLTAQISEIQIGLEGGGGIRSLYGNRYLAETGKLGLGHTVGVFGQFSLSDRFALRTSVSFERKGFSQKGKIVDPLGVLIGEVQDFQNLDYLTLPIMGRFTFGESVQFFFNTGPYLGALLKYEQITKVTGQAEFNFQFTDQFNRLDLGWATGIGMQIPIGTNLMISTELRNHLGLLNISSVPVIDDKSIKTLSSYLLVGLGYRFTR
ncbi:porin family protein [Pontibacter sp. G13]|uniref:porin family protein n=1 Tax=Pontibacter sp. G13 TaxID=3074898 RepID=UPI00288C0131|nr:porin family protein [Pontibacter sp. G13]WNJ19630.1 porin family protein [Pontibacter sp. G13]